MEIEKDEIFALAEQYIESTGTSVFLTGKAGTGKTTFLKHITSTTTKRHVVLAPTGVAAINAGGSTIHSFFQLPLCPYLPDIKELVTEYQMEDKYRKLRKERIKIIRSLELLIIDEISMVRADILDAVDNELRRYRRSSLPFGGLQLLMIGDTQQLSPVVKDNEQKYLSQVYASPYFFSAKSLQTLSYVTIELQKAHRQKDSGFLDILNAIRDNRIDAKLLHKLNERVGKDIGNDGDAEPIRLTTHNRQADSINNTRMEKLPGKYYSLCAEIEGEFPENSYPVEPELRLKKGAQVMFVRNDPEGEYYNGKIGVVESITPEGVVTVTARDGATTVVTPVVWENIQYNLDKESGEISQNVAGSFKQLPLRPAWAITIHKSQGLTFDKVIIDVGSAFAFGQVYVALSRCRSLEGISLDVPIYPRSIYSDVEVSRFNESRLPVSEVRDMLSSARKRYSFDQMRQLFNLDSILKPFRWLYKLWRNNLQKLYPQAMQELDELNGRLNEADRVSKAFCRQLSELEGTLPAESPYVTERLAKAAGYFLPGVTELLLKTSGILELETDNKEVRKNVKEVGGELLTQTDILYQALEMIKDRGFSIEGYLRIRTACLIDDGQKARAKRINRLRGENGTSSDVNTELKDRLTEWRSARFKADNVPAFHILFQSTLLEIAARKPKTKEELLKIKGFGETKYAKYGQEILDICKDY